MFHLGSSPTPSRPQRSFGGKDPVSSRLSQYNLKNCIKVFFYSNTYVLQREAPKDELLRRQEPPRLGFVNSAVMNIGVHVSFQIRGFIFFR